MIETLEDLAKTIRNRVHNDKDAVIAITGYEGDGKSTLAIVLAKALDEHFSFDKNVLFSPTTEEIEGSIKNLPKYSVIIADEAIKAFYKKKHAGKMAIMLNIIYAICRQENKISILCIPRFCDLLEFFRNHRVFLWIHVIKRGTAICMIKDWSPFTDDPWHLKQNQQILDKMFNRIPIIEQTDEDKTEAIGASRGCIGIVRWDDLDAETKEAYLKMKKANAYEKIDQYWDTTRTEREKMLRQNLIKLVKAVYEDGWTQEEIGEVIDKKNSTISKWINGELEG